MTSRAWDAGRERFSLRTRWQIVRHRRRCAWTQWWRDLQYLLRG